MLFVAHEQNASENAANSKDFRPGIVLRQREQDTIDLG